MSAVRFKFLCGLEAKNRWETPAWDHIRPKLNARPAYFLKAKQTELIQNKAQWPMGQKITF